MKGGTLEENIKSGGATKLSCSRTRAGKAGDRERVTAGERQSSNEGENREKGSSKEGPPV